MKTAIIGIGNPLLTDDRVGIQVARSLARRLRRRPEISVLECCAGGIRLMEAMAGNDRVFLIDSIQTEGGRPGTVYRLTVADLRETRHAHSSHDSNLAVALEFGRMADLRLPQTIVIWAIEAGDVATVGEQLTPPVEQAARETVASLLRELEKGGEAAAGELT